MTCHSSQTNKDTLFSHSGCIRVIRSSFSGVTINSSAVVTNNAKPGVSQYGLAYFDSADPNAPASVGLSGNELLVLPALVGDADFSSVVNFHDLQILLGGFGQPNGWAEGNFNYHSTVDFNDLQLLLGNFNASAALSDAELSGIENLVGEFGDVATPNADGNGFTLTSVPEPSLGIFTLGILATASLNRRMRLKSKYRA